MTVTDVTEVPSLPDAPTVTSSTISSLTITWTEPTNTGPAISAYDVRYILTSVDETVDANWTEVCLDEWCVDIYDQFIEQNTSYVQMMKGQVTCVSDSDNGSNNAPVGIGKIYWADRGSDKIQDLILMGVVWKTWL